MSAPILEGQIIGKYRVLEALGRGGMARVYRAYHAQLDRFVAIKVLRSDLVEDKDLLARFQREARAIASLRHANIVQVFDFDTQDDCYYMVMELLEGNSLRAKLNSYRTESQRMPLPEVLAIIHDVLNGLGFAHSQGIIHRDVKPANIMLTSRGEAVITDFGIAQIVGSTQMTISGMLMGTLSYMAPEQGLQGACDQRSDLYSLGIVLYEMLTGYTPFDADTPLAILMKHLNDPLPLPRRIDPDLPQSLEQILLKVLAKNPSDRYQSAEEMAAALAQIPAQELPAGPRRQIPTPPEIDPKAVYSGTSRQDILDRDFAKEETDPYLASKLMQKKPVSAPALPELPSNPLEKVFARRLNVPGTVVGALGGILFINFLANVLSTLTGVNIYSRGWGFDLFLVAGFLAVLMWALENHWLLIPVIIIFGNAALLTYTLLSGRWGDWVFLWMPEIIVIGVAVYIPIRMVQSSSRLKTLAHTWGGIFSLLSVAMAILTCLLALQTGLLR
ncbi:MAG: protein kinase [Chloroflexi bacterium]|nr:protein kinase [Chloroflexota bacterium]